MVFSSVCTFSAMINFFFTVSLLTEAAGNDLVIDEEESFDNLVIDLSGEDEEMPDDDCKNVDSGRVQSTNKNIFETVFEENQVLNGFLDTNISEESDHQLIYNGKSHLEKLERQLLKENKEKCLHENNNRGNHECLDCYTQNTTISSTDMHSDAKDSVGSIFSNISSTQKKLNLKKKVDDTSDDDILEIKEIVPPKKKRKLNSPDISETNCEDSTLNTDFNKVDSYPLREVSIDDIIKEKSILENGGEANGTDLPSSDETILVDSDTYVDDDTIVVDTPLESNPQTINLKELAKSCTDKVKKQEEKPHNEKPPVDSGDKGKKRNDKPHEENTAMDSKSMLKKKKLKSKSTGIHKDEPVLGNHSSTDKRTSEHGRKKHLKKKSAKLDVSKFVGKEEVLRC